MDARRGTVSSLHSPERLYTNLECEQVRFELLALVLKQMTCLNLQFLASKHRRAILQLCCYKVCIPVFTSLSGPLLFRNSIENSPVELVEIILSYQPEVGPKEKQKERAAQDDEPCTLPLWGKTKRQATLRMTTSRQFVSTFIHVIRDQTLNLVLSVLFCKTDLTWSM